MRKIGSANYAVRLNGCWFAVLVDPEARLTLGQIAELSATWRPVRRGNLQLTDPLVPSPVLAKRQLGRKALRRLKLSNTA